MKRAVSFILGLVFVLSLTACSSTPEISSTEGNNTDKPVADSLEPKETGSLYLWEGTVAKLPAEDDVRGSHMLFYIEGMSLPFGTSANTKSFDARDNSSAIMPQLSVGEHILIWTSPENRSIRCLLAHANEGPYAGNCYTVGKVEANGDNFVFTDADGAVRVTAAREDVDYPEKLTEGAVCFVWSSKTTDEKPEDISAESVVIVTSITSAELVSFSCGYPWYEQDMYSEFFLEKTDDGAVMTATVRAAEYASSTDNTVTVECVVDGSKLTQLQQILLEHNTARLDGYSDADGVYRHDMGSSLTMLNAAGESIEAAWGTGCLFLDDEACAIYRFFVALAAENGYDIDLIPLPDAADK